jgi:hypothetical protein
MEMRTSAAPGTATGYTLVLPPGWVRIPLRSGTDKAIRAAVRHATSVLPAGARQDRIVKQRLAMERHLTQTARDARSKGGVDMYLPAGPVYDVPVAASFLVSELSLGPASPSLVARHLATSDDIWKLVTVDSTDGLRIERIAQVQQDEGTRLGSRNVTYVLPVPGRIGSWLMIAFSTLGTRDPDDTVAGLLADLFDAILSPFLWQRENP